MPTSFIHAVPTIVETVTALSPESILDIGIGFGKYGVLLREALEVAHLRYHREDWKIHDVVLRIDVLEHFEKEKGKRLIAELLKHAKQSLLISTPRFPAPQEAYLDNLFEAHRSRWHIPDFVDFDFAYRYLPLGNNGAQIFHLFPHPTTNI